MQSLKYDKILCIIGCKLITKDMKKIKNFIIGTVGVIDFFMILGCNGTFIEYLIEFVVLILVCKYFKAFEKES